MDIQGSCDLNLDVLNQPLSPDDHIPLLEMRYSASILRDRFATFRGLDWFSPEVTTQELTNNMEIGQSLRIRYEIDESPFDNVRVQDVQYKEDQTCPPQLDIECAPGCISTAPSWRAKDILYDKIYTVGASWCVRTERLTYGTLEQRFQKSLRDAQMVQSVYAWTKLICEAVANPAKTLLPTDAQCFPYHYVKGGSAASNGVDVMTAVISYMQALYGERFSTDFGIFAHRYFETDLVSSGSSIHQYNNTGIQTMAINRDRLTQGGFRPIASLPQGLWGHDVLIAPDSKYLYSESSSPGQGAGVVQSYNPFLSNDGTKYYVLIASRRSFYTGVTPLMDMRRFPATCDNKYESIQQEWLGFNDVLFPEEVFVIEFDVDCMAETSPGQISPGQF